jgi:hypothetical protein
VVTQAQLVQLEPQLPLQQEPLQLVQPDLVQQLQMLELAQLPYSTSQFLVVTQVQPDQLVQLVLLELLQLSLLVQPQRVQQDLALALQTLELAQPPYLTLLSQLVQLGQLVQPEKLVQPVPQEPKAHLA